MFANDDGPTPEEGAGFTATGDYCRTGCQEQQDRLQEAAGPGACRSAGMKIIANPNTGNLQGERPAQLPSATGQSDLAACWPGVPVGPYQHGEEDSAAQRNFWWSDADAEQGYSYHLQQAAGSYAPVACAASPRATDSFTCYQNNYPCGTETLAPVNAYAPLGQPNDFGRAATQGFAAYQSLGTKYQTENQGSCDLVEINNPSASVETQGTLCNVAAVMSSAQPTCVDEQDTTSAVSALHQGYAPSDGGALYYGYEADEMCHPSQPIKFRIRTITDCEFQCPSTNLPMLSANCIFPSLSCQQQGAVTPYYPPQGGQQGSDAARLLHLPGGGCNFPAKAADDHRPWPSGAGTLQRSPGDKTNDPSGTQDVAAQSGADTHNSLCDSAETSENSTAQLATTTPSHGFTDYEENKLQQETEMLKSEHEQQGTVQPTTERSDALESHFQMTPAFVGFQCQPTVPVKMEIPEQIPGSYMPSTAGAWCDGVKLQGPATFSAICPSAAVANSTTTMPVLPYQRPSWFTADAYSRHSIRVDSMVNGTPSTFAATCDGGLEANVWKSTKTSYNKRNTDTTKKQRRAVDKKPSEEKKFKCTYEDCNKRFLREQELKVHKNKHHLGLKKPYFCDTCDKSFRRPDQLKRHQKIHTGEKPHECSICGRCFARTDHRNTHYNKHSGEKPFSCRRHGCDRKFSRSDELRRHEAKHASAPTTIERQGMADKDRFSKREMAGSRLIGSRQGVYVEGLPKQQTTAMIPPFYGLPPTVHQQFQVSRH